MSQTMTLEETLIRVWHKDAASNSLERWQELAQQENWNISDDVLSRMTMVFGASWYFTRFCFFRGSRILPLFAVENLSITSIESSLQVLEKFTTESSLDEAVEKLRIKKNEIMLSILILQLSNVIKQEQAEELLTKLADAVLIVMHHLFGLDQLEDIKCIVLGMGRFAGYEMNYGSDLDLIFIEKISKSNSDAHIGNKVRKMLRYISTMDPSGALYEIDMRLRPHGSSGVLVTPLQSFLKFHRDDREIWERQMMTRCRVIVGDKALSTQIKQEVLNDIYNKYETSYLAKEIMKVRLLVEQELAGGMDKIELKRGKGGVMDIDFLSHFLQLAYGSEHTQLQNASTRTVLKESASLNLINEKAATLLLNAYDFYKKSEAALRVFDMKSISKVDKDMKSLLPLARATGFIDEDADKAISQYQDKLFQYREEVRQLFNSVIEDSI